MVRFQFKRLLQCTIYNQKKEMKKSRLYYKVIFSYNFVNYKCFKRNEKITVILFFY